MTIIERLTHEAVQLDPTDPRRIVMRDAIQRLEWFEESGGVAVHARVHQQQAVLERLTAERDRLKAALEQAHRVIEQCEGLVATAIQNCQLHSADPDADESYRDGKERAYRNVLAWLREAEQRPLVRPRG